MLEFLRDSIWQFIGALVGVVAIILTIALSRSQRRDKGLSFEIVANTRLLTVAEEIQSRVAILLDGIPVEQLHYTLVKVMNSGSAPIPARDYETPITINLGEKSEIVSVEVIEASPASLAEFVTLTANRNEVEVAPLLLNSGDSLTLKLLVNKARPTITMQGRIADIKEILNEETVVHPIAWHIKRYFVGTSILSWLGTVFVLFMTMYAMVFMISQGPMITLSEDGSVAITTRRVSINDLIWWTATATVVISFGFVLATAVQGRRREIEKQKTKRHS